MQLRTRRQPQPLRYTLLVIILWTGTVHGNEKLFDNFNEANTCVGSDTYLCGCQAVPSSHMSKIETLLRQELPCEELCSQRTCEQTCATSACSYEMGTLGEFCTTTILDQAMVNYVRSADCTFHDGMLTYECIKGNSVAYPDRHTYQAIMEGYCIPSCGLDVSLFECTFEPRFREETDVKPEDLDSPPYTIIAGAEFTDVQHGGPVSTDVPDVQDPEPTDPHSDPRDDDFGGLTITTGEVEDPEGTHDRDPARGEDKGPGDGEFSPSPSPSETEEAPKEAPKVSRSPELKPAEAPAPSSEVADTEEPLEDPPAPSSEVSKIDEPLETPLAPPSEVAEIEEPLEDPSAPSSEVFEIDEPLETPPASEPAEADESEVASEPSAISEDVEKPAPSEIEVVSQEPLESSTASDFTLYYSEFGECPQVCSQAGDSYRERFITCRNHAGVPVALNSCSLPQDLNERYFSKCQTEECGPDYYVVLSDWSRCSNTCAKVLRAGTVIPNISVRDYACRRVSDDSQVDASECEDLVQNLGVVSRRDCDSVPCERYVYLSSDWGSCDCETWQQERTLTCVDRSSGEEVDASVCNAFGLTAPAIAQHCYPKDCFESTSNRKLLQSDLDYCDFTQCSTKGSCDDGECVCRGGFDGLDCQMDFRRDSECPLPSLLDEDGDCCGSGVFDLEGTCCDALNSESEIDIDGKCCTGRPLDGCGQCSEDVARFLDAAGQCCQAMDASGTCCESGYIDECGVCDGFGRSCNTTISFDVRIRRNQDIDECVRELRSIVGGALDVHDPALETSSASDRRISFSKTGVDLTTGLIWFRMQEALENRDVNELCGIDGYTSSKLPVCGNGYCEIDEHDTCPQDCDYGIQMCEKQVGLYNQPVMCNGHGLCLFADRSSCSCFTGYEGENCELCSEGFFHVEDDNRCIPGQGFTARPAEPIPIREFVPVQPSAGTPVFITSTRTADAPSAERNSDGGVIYWPIIAGACILGLLFVLLIAFVVLRRRRLQKSADVGERDALNSGELDSHQPEPVRTARTFEQMWAQFNRDIAPTLTDSGPHAQQAQSPSAESSTL